MKHQIRHQNRKVISRECLKDKKMICSFLKNPKSHKDHRAQWKSFSGISLTIACCLVLGLTACREENSRRGRVGGGISPELGGSAGGADALNPSAGTNTDTRLTTHMGGADTGGGDGMSSTPQQIFDTLQKVKRTTLPVAFYRVSRLMEPISEPEMQQPQELLPEDLRVIFDSVLAGNHANADPIFQDVLNANWRLVIDGPCYDRTNREHDASAQEDGTICFSLPRLVSVPFHNLEKELTALSAHEHIHRYDMWEEGIVVQEFFLRTGERFQNFRNFVTPDPSTVNQMVRELARVRLAALNLSDMLNPEAAAVSEKIYRIGEQSTENFEEIEAEANLKGDATNDHLINLKRGPRKSYVVSEGTQIPDTMICSHLGRLSGLISNLFGGGDSDQYESTGEGVMLHPNYWSIAGRLSQRVASAFTFCGFTVYSGYGLKTERVHIDGPYYAPMSKGDREQLSEIVQLIASDANEFQSDTHDYL
ncbi:MAG: hypothetical protein AAF202_05850, partial [Pseudomonadota bacterium]